MKDKRKQKLLKQKKATRVLIPFNTGTRPHKSKKDYSRKWEEND